MFGWRDKQMKIIKIVLLLLATIVFSIVYQIDYIKNNVIHNKNYRWYVTHTSINISSILY